MMPFDFIVLYNLRENPGENLDLSGGPSERVMGLKARLAETGERP